MENQTSLPLTPLFTETIPFGVNNILGFSRSPLAFMRLFTGISDDIVSLRFGFYKVHFLKHPDLIRQVLVNDARNYQTWWLEKQINARFTRLDSLLFDDAFHSEQRQKVQPALQKNHIGVYLNSIISATEQTVSSWQSGHTYNITKEMTHLALKISCNTLFDADFEGEIDAITQAMEDFHDIMQWIRQTIFPMPAWVRPSQDRLYVFDDNIRKIIEKHRRGESRSHVLDKIVGTQGASLSDKQLRDAIFALLFASYATTATALTWMWALVAKYQDVERRLLNELDATVAPGDPLSLEKLEQLEFNEAVAREVLRLYPPIWLFVREARQDGIIGDQPIKKGSLIAISPYAVQRDPRFYPDPQRFKPERFLGRRPIAHSYIPFGAGTSMCVGHAFATMTMQTVLATILRRFRLVSPEQLRLTPEAQLTLRLKDELYLKVEAR